jgi:hypothetical protein
MDLDPTLIKSTNSTTSLRSFSARDSNTMNPARLSRRLLVFQEARNPSNMSEIVYLPVNKLGLPICGPGPELPSILELPLRILKAFTDIFNQPKYKGWYVFLFTLFSFCYPHVDNYKNDGLMLLTGPFWRRAHTMIPRKRASIMLWCWSRLTVMLGRRLCPDDLGSGLYTVLYAMTM